MNYIEFEKQSKALSGHNVSQRLGPIESGLHLRPFLGIQT